MLLSNDLKVPQINQPKRVKPSDALNGEEKFSPQDNSKSKVELVDEENNNHSPSRKNEPTKIAGTISYVEDDGIVMPSKMTHTRIMVDQAVQVNICE